MTDKLVEALERCAQIVERNLGRQDEKIADVPIVARRAIDEHRRALSSRPDAGEAVAWMYEHKEQGRSHVVAERSPDPDAMKSKGWVETALGKIAHPTAAVAGEGERPATYEYDSGTGWETHTVLNTPPNLPTKLAPAKHYGSSDIRNVRAFFYSRSQPAADAVGTGGLTEALERLDFLYGKGNLDDDAREVIHFAICAIDCALSTPPRQPDDADARELIGYYASHRPEQADREIANDVLEHSFADGRMLNFRDLVLIATRSRLAATKSPDVDGGAK